MIPFTFLVGFNFVKLLFFYSSYTSHCVRFIGLIIEKGRVLQYFELWIFLAEIEIVYFLNQIWKIQGKNLNFQENCHWKLWNVKGFFFQKSWASWKCSTLKVQKGFTPKECLHKNVLNQKTFARLWIFFDWKNSYIIDSINIRVVSVPINLKKLKL